MGGAPHDSLAATRTARISRAADLAGYTSSGPLHEGPQVETVHATNSSTSASIREVVAVVFEMISVVDTLTYLLCHAGLGSF